MVGEQDSHETQLNMKPRFEHAALIDHVPSSGQGDPHGGHGDDVPEPRLHQLKMREQYVALGGVTLARLRVVDEQSDPVKKPGEPASEADDMQGFGGEEVHQFEGTGRDGEVFADATNCREVRYSRESVVGTIVVAWIT